MVDCDRRQKEVTPEGEQHRCLEKKVPDTYLKIVDVPTCEGCPLMALKAKAKPCETKPDWESELLEVLPVSSDALHVLHTPGQREGYASPCTYRWDGVCTITGHKIDPEICKACDQETADEMANLPTKLKNYAGAIKRWIREGRPTRTDEEVAERLEICMGNPEKGIPRCKLYDEDSHACKKCGCAVSTDKAPLGNKIRMKTESCPMNLWK